MDLFDRYLHAVRGFLPKGQQDDVIRELSEELRSQAEEQEAQLGRPLIEAEQAHILKQWQHPMLLASRYQPKRYVIGPAVFPIYWLVLKIALGVTLIVHLVAAAVFLANGRPTPDIMNALFRFQPFVLAFAWVTLVFAALDRAVLGLSVFTEWNPRSLSEPKHAHATSSWGRIVEIVMTAAFLAWLTVVPYNQWLMFGPASTLIALGPAWRDVHLVVVALFSVSLFTMILAARNHERDGLRAATRAATDVAMLVVLVYLLKSADPFIEARSAQPGAESLAALMNKMARIGLGVTVVVMIIEIAKDMFRLLQRTRWPGRWSPRQG